MSKRKVVGGMGMGEARSSSTMFDVARLAKVSVMTVWRVLNNKHAVTERTRQKVAQAVTTLNFVPNQGARRLAGKKPIRIGFISGNRSSTYLNEFLVELLNQSRLNNAQLCVKKREESEWEQRQVGRLFERGLDGIILPPPLCDEEALVAHIRTCGIPVVAVGRGLPDPALGTVSMDDEPAAYDMTRHLISLGHHRIGFVSGAPDQTASVPRLAGYRRALRELCADTSDELVAQGWFTYRSGLDAAGQLLALPARPTAIFASNDDMAAAVIAVAQRAGLDVPGDLTVAGFDDAPLATSVWPELTTVRQPIADMAREAVEMIVRQVRSLRAGETVLPEYVRLGWELVRRQSDAVPRVRPAARAARLDLPAGEPGPSACRPSANSPEQR